MLLNGMSKLGPVSMRKLLATNNNDPREILASTRSKLLSVDGVGPAMVDSILKSENENWLEKEKKATARMGINFLTEEYYPKILKEIYDPPIGLYVLGTIPKIPILGIVGTRKPSLYGKRICHELATGLAEAGFCIASGMARGIDSIAHSAALAVEGETIAILGSGIDIIYPPENIKLYQEISNRGAVVSEFPLGRKADRRTFPMRNRLVSGVSSGIIVIESASSGGSLITAQFAAEQGRLVFAVPGRVDQPSSAGCNDLIRDGAILVRNVQDVLDEIRNNIPAEMAYTGNEDEKSPSMENIKFFNADSLKNEEKKVFSILKDGSCLGIEEIMENVEMNFSQLSSTLSMMEISGVLEKRTDGKFELK